MPTATDRARSKIKQVASGRFGVTPHYLVNADELQIKMAQGAKPGEGGQLPGHKVSEYIGQLRHSVPGVTLIAAAAPRHLLDRGPGAADLRPEELPTPKADGGVKLVSRSRCRHRRRRRRQGPRPTVIIAGYDGGTGASPMTSIKHAGAAVGDRPRRDPADAGPQRPARPHPVQTDGQLQDRPRRHHRRPAGRRGVRLRDRRRWSPSAAS